MNQGAALGTFQTEAIQIIMKEVERVMTTSSDTGVVFSSSPHYHVIHVADIRHGCHMGQEHTYDRRLWRDLHLALALVEYLTPSRNNPPLVEFREHIAPAWHTRMWAIDFQALDGCNALSTMRSLLTHIDTAIALLNQPIAP